MCVHPCLCESIKTPSLCFPKSINYSWRGGLSGRVPLGQSNLSSGFEERKAGHGAESKTHISLSLRFHSCPTCSGVDGFAQGTCQRELRELAGSRPVEKGDCEASTPSA